MRFLWCEETAGSDACEDQRRRSSIDVPVAEKYREWRRTIDMRTHGEEQVGKEKGKEEGGEYKSLDLIRRDSDCGDIPGKWHATGQAGGRAACAGRICGSSLRQTGVEEVPGRVRPEEGKREPTGSDEWHNWISRRVDSEPAALRRRGNLVSRNGSWMFKDRDSPFDRWCSWCSRIKILRRTRREFAAEPF